MPVPRNQSIEIKSYEINYNFVKSKQGKSDRLAVIMLHSDPSNALAQAELHFYPALKEIDVSEQVATSSGNPYDHVDIKLSSDHLLGICELLRNEKPLYITFLADTAGAIQNVWFGTATRERVGEGESHT